MKKTIFFAFILIIFIVGYFLNENAKQVEAWVHERIYISTNSIEESKQMGIFDSELIVDSIVLINKYEKIVINEVWIEKERFKARKETYIEEGRRIFVFSISINSPEPYLKDSVNFTWGVNINQKNASYSNDYLAKEYPHQYYDAVLKNGIVFNFFKTYDPQNGTYRFDILRNKNQNEGKGRQVVGYIILSKKR